MKYTDDDLLSSLQEEFQLTGKIPSQKQKRKIHRNVYINRFGTWNNVLSKAGVTPRKQKRATITKNCLQCGGEFKTKTYINAEFCSVKCSNTSRQKATSKPQRLSREVWLQDLREKWNQVPFEELGWEGRRKRVIQEQDGKCNKCGLDEWMGEPLILEADHKNGNRKDHSRENLEGLCPNCHSLTPTWKGKNRGNSNHLTDEELKSILENAPNICQGLTLAGMSPRGANYIRAKRLLNGPIV